MVDHSKFDKLDHPQIDPKRAIQKLTNDEQTLYHK